MADIVGGKIVISFDDGTTSELQLAVTTPTPDPVPVPTPLPAAPNRATVNGVAHALDGINKPRQADELILLRPPLAVSETNQWGAEATVIDGKVTALSDRQKTGATTGTPIPSGGYLLSGHGSARDWLLANAKPGATVTLETVDPPAPTPKPTPDPKPTPGQKLGKIVAGYLMDGQDVDQIPACYNQLRIAFIRMSNGQLQAVEWGGKTPAQTQAQLATWVKQGGHEVLLSEGGAGGGDNLGNVNAFVSGFQTLAPKYSATGLDFDEEGGALNVGNAVSLGKALAAGREKTFTLSFVPPGGDPVDVYMRAAVACQQAGLRVIFGFQGYDAVDSDDQIMGRTADAVAKLGEASVVVGFMVGDDDAHRTPSECESLMRKVVARWPNIAGAYFWELARPGTTDAAQRVAKVLGL